MLINACFLHDTEVRCDTFSHPDAPRLIVNFEGFSSRIIIPLNGLSVDVEPTVQQKTRNLEAQISTLDDTRSNLMLIFLDSTCTQRSRFFEHVTKEHVFRSNTSLYLAYPSLVDEQKEGLGYVKFFALCNITSQEDEHLDRGNYRVINSDKFADISGDHECTNGDPAVDTDFLLSETRPQDVNAKHPFIVNPVREKIVDYYLAYQAEWKIDD